MEVIVHSTLNSVQGRVIVATDPAQSVDSLITAFCVEKGVPHRRHYTLRNKDLQVLANHKQLRNCGIGNEDILYLGLKDSDDDWCCGCNQWWLIATVALLIGCAGLAAITVLHIMQERTLYEYGLIIDAGSTHSQIFVYKWPGKKDDLTAHPEQILTRKTKPGISSYENKPEEAGPSLDKLLKDATDAVPKEDRSRSLIYLGATGGMRLLDASDKDASDDIMNSTRNTISEFEFDFADPINQSRILDGRDEGAFSWVTANYASEVFKQETPVPLGALDLGGASTQITFIPSNTSDNGLPNHETLVLYNKEYSVYTYSYLCYGANEAQRQYLAQLVIDQNYTEVVDDACRPLGNTTQKAFDYVFEAPCTLKMPAMRTTDHKNKTFTFRGTSNPKQCAESVKNMFNFTAPCTTPPCTFNGVSMPPVYGNFLAFSGFFYPMKFLNLTKEPSFSLAKFEDTYKDFCNKTWAQVSVIPPEGGDLAQYCFESNYIHTLLIDGYKFDEQSWKNIQFIQQIGDTELGWSLGYMLNTSYSIPQRIPEQRISNVLFALLVVLFAIFLGTAVGFACHAKNQRHTQSDYQKMASYGSI